MKEVRRNIFARPQGVLCVTVNGYVKKDGKAVMGRGVAQVARTAFPGIDLQWGRLLERQGRPRGREGQESGLGNHVAVLLEPSAYHKHVEVTLVAFPTKWNWWERSDLSLIERSTAELVALADKRKWDRVMLPRPGCGNGGLEWPEVKEVVAPYLDDRFVVCFLPDGPG